MVATFHDHSLVAKQTQFHESDRCFPQASLTGAEVFGSLFGKSSGEIVCHYLRTFPRYFEYHLSQVFTEPRMLSSHVLWNSQQL